jgi:hypothetical protein
MAAPLVYTNRKHEIQSVVAAITPWRRWMLAQGQLLTEARLLNFEEFFIPLLRYMVKIEKAGIVWTYLFLSPEA